MVPLAVADEDGETDWQQVTTNVDDNLIVSGAATNGSLRPNLDMSSPAYRVAQRYSIVVLYHVTNGTNWFSSDLWLEPGVHECDFVGVTCEYANMPSITLREAILDPDALPHHEDGTVDVIIERVVVAIDLPENNVGGIIPREVAGLPYLRRLGLWSNVIGGSIPPELGALARLSSLLLDDNLFVGNIPEEFGTLTEMTDLSLGPNAGISGRIPEEIGDMLRLERLNLSEMSLMGPIPTSFGRLTNLTELNLRGNELGRGLPEEMKDLVNLESLILSDNDFTGSIPRSWRSLVKLERLEIQSNDMSFDVNEDICSLRSDSEGSFGSLETLVVDCEGVEPKVRCDCCTSCSR